MAHKRKNRSVNRRGRKTPVRRKTARRKVARRIKKIARAKPKRQVVETPVICPKQSANVRLANRLWDASRRKRFAKKRDSSGGHLVRGVSLADIDADTADQVAYEGALLRQKRTAFVRPEDISNEQYRDFVDLAARAECECGEETCHICCTSTDIEADPRLQHCERRLLSESSCRVLKFDVVVPIELREELRLIA